MTRRTLADDAAAVLLIFEHRKPRTPIEHMALVGAKATMKRQAALAAYRERHKDRLGAYAREKAAERRAKRKAERIAAGETIRPRGRPRKEQSE